LKILIEFLYDSLFVSMNVAYRHMTKWIVSDPDELTCELLLHFEA